MGKESSEDKCRQMIMGLLWKCYFDKHSDEFTCSECKSLFDPKSECAISEFIRQADCDSRNQKVLEWWLHHLKCAGPYFGASTENYKEVECCSDGVIPR